MPSYKLTDENLTTAVTRHLRVRAIDHTAKATGASGNKSSWTATASATSGDILQNDIRDGEATGFWEQDVSSVTGNGIVITLTATGMRGGQPAVVDFSWRMQGADNLIFAILRDSSPIYNSIGSGPSLGPGHYHVKVPITSTSGSHTFAVQFGPHSVTSVGLRLTVQEKRR